MAAKPEKPIVCVFGQRTDTPNGKAPGWEGEHHCVFCHAEAMRPRDWSLGHLEPVTTRIEYEK